MKSFRKKKKLALLEIGKTRLKLAVLEENFDDFEKNIVITKLLTIDLDDRKDFREVFNQPNLDFDDFILILSRNQVTIRNLELPSTDPREIQDIISLQVRKQTPFSADEIVSDFQASGPASSDYTRILMAIVQKSVINGCLNNFISRKITVQKIVLDSECLVNWYPILKEKYNDDTLALVDFDAGFCDFCVLSRERLLFTRLLPFGPLDLSEEYGRKGFLEELKTSLDIYRNENLGPAFNKIIFMGQEKLARDLSEILAGELNLKVAVFSEGREGTLALSAEAKSARERGLSENISFSKIMGLAINPERPGLDFLPPDLKEARKKGILKKELTLVGALIFLVMALGLVIFFEKIYTRALFLNRLDNQLARLAGQTGELEKADTKIRLIKSRMNAGNSALEVLSQIHKVTPQEIYLSNIEFEENNLVSLRGTVASMSSVYKFVKTLEEMAIFREVRAKYVTKRQIKDQDLTDFEIVCQLVREAGADLGQ